MTEQEQRVFDAITDLDPLGEQYEDWLADDGPDGLETWHRMEIVGHEDGSATVYHASNDDDDDGYPDPEVSHYEIHYGGPAGFERAKAACGVSRRGFFGCEVTVIVSGEPT